MGEGWVEVNGVALSTFDYQYDANGNMTSQLETLPDGVTSKLTTYEWDALNQLVAINQGTQRSEFTYDGMGRRVRIKEISNSVTTSDRFYLWNGLSTIASGPYSTPGITGATKKYFPQGYILSGDDPYYYMKDHLGSVRAILQSKEGVVGSYDYDAYGNLVNSPLGPKDSDFLYTGHFYHRPSGLYLAPYRAYDPRRGRWLSREPLGLDGPNLYQYAFNEPMANLDPDGLQIILNTIPVTDPYHHNPFNDPQLFPRIPGRFTVGGHGCVEYGFLWRAGNSGKYSPLSPDKLIEWMSQFPEYEDSSLIVLYACNVGEKYAQELADKSGKQVVWPDQKLFVTPQGPRTWRDGYSRIPGRWRNQRPRNFYRSF